MRLKRDVYTFDCSGTPVFVREPAAECKIVQCVPEQDREPLMDAYRAYKNGRLFNAETVCINAISRNEQKDPEIHICKGDFYSFVLSNLIALDTGGFTAFLMRSPQWSYLLDTVQKMQETAHGRTFRSLKEMVNSRYFTNTLAVSMLLTDDDGYALLTQRTSSTILSQDFFGVTATGSVDGGDYASDNPILTCAKRELKEELNIDLPEEMFELKAIVCGKQKLQPIALVNANVTGSLNVLLRDSASARDYHKEISHTIPMSRIAAEQFAEDAKMTEAARYHIRSWARSSDWVVF